MHSYKHEHKGIMDLGWEGLGEALKELAAIIARDFRPDVVVGIAKGGVVPAVFLSSAFLVEFLPIKLSSRRNEVVVHDEPVWFVRPTPDIKGRHILLVDDISVAGRTLAMAKSELLTIGAAEVRTATLAVHLGSARPDYYAIETDDCILFPWDKQVLDGLEWIMNPELQEQIEKLEQAE